MGTITYRDTIVAPTRGVVMEVAYTLEWVKLDSGESVVMEVEAQDMFQDVAPAIAEAIGELLGN